MVVGGGVGFGVRPPLFLSAQRGNPAHILFVLGPPGIVGGLHAYPNPGAVTENLPSRTATAGDTGLRSRKMS